MTGSDLSVSSPKGLTAATRWLLAGFSLAIPFVFDSHLADTFQLPKHILFRWAALLLLGIWLWMVLRAGRIEGVGSVVLAPLLLLMFISLLSLFPAPNAFYAASRVRDLVLAGALLVVCVPALVPSRFLPAGALGTAAILTALLGLLQLLAGPGLGFLPITQGGAYAGDVSTAALFVAMVLPLVFGLGLSPTTGARWYWSLGAGMATAFVVLARTRAAWLAAVVGLMALILMRFPSAPGRDASAPSSGRASPWRYLGVAGLIAFLVVIVATWGTGIQILSAPPSLKMVELQGMDLRFVTWESTLKMILSYPLGVGLGNWSYAFPASAGTLGNQSPLTLARYPAQAGNEYLQIAAEIGVAGLIVFLWMAWRLLSSGWRQARHPTGDAIGRGAVAGLLGLVAGMFLATPLREQPTGWAALLLACLTLASTGGGAAGGRSPVWELRAERRRWAAPSIFSAFVVLIVLTGWSTYRTLQTDMLLQAGQSACVQRDYVKALPALVQAGNMAPGHYRARYLAGVCAQEASQWDIAEEELLAARRLNPYDARTLLALASTFKAKGNVIEAVAAVEKARDLWPADETVQTALGEVLEASGDLPGAAQAFGEAIARNPYSVRAHLRLGSILEKDNRMGAAISTYTKAANLDPYDPEALFYLGRAYVKQGMFEASLELFRQLRGVAPQSAQAYLGLGRSFAGIGRFCDAATALDEALKHQPNLNSSAGIERTLEEYRRKCDQEGALTGTEEPKR